MSCQGGGQRAHERGLLSVHRTPGTQGTVRVLWVVRKGLPSHPEVRGGQEGAAPDEGGETGLGWALPQGH